MTQQQQQQTVNINLTIDGINLVLRGLDQLPHGQSRQIVDDIINQAQAQVKPAATQEFINESAMEPK